MALRIASEYPKVKVRSAGEHEIRLSHTMTKREIAGMVGAMIAHDVVVTGFHKREGDLETLFMRVTEGDGGIEGDAGTEGGGGIGSGISGNGIDAGNEGEFGVEGGTGGGESAVRKEGSRDVVEPDC